MSDKKPPIEMFGAAPPGGGAATPGPGPQKPPRRPSRLPKLVMSRGMKLLAVFLVVFLLLFNSLFTYVKPNEWGLRQVKIALFSDTGTRPEPLGPGLHFAIPGLHVIHTLPRDIQVLELTENFSTSAEYADLQQAAHIQTSDGFYVDVDISILYHIESPFLTFMKFGLGTGYFTQGISPKILPALKETLGQLTTEEFYNSHLRVEKAMEAQELLNRRLTPDGLVVDEVLIRYFRYSDEIQRNIEEKKLKDQLVFKNIAEAEAARIQAELIRVREEGEKTLKIKLAEGEAYVQRRRAEQEEYVRTVRAQADLLVNLAEAERTRLRNEALQGAGSDRMVGLEMAKAMQGLSVIVLPSDGELGVNPLNLEALLQLFDVRSQEMLEGAAPEAGTPLYEFHMETEAEVVQ